MASGRDRGRTRIAVAATPGTASSGASQPGTISAGQRRPRAAAAMTSSPVARPGAQAVGGADSRDVGPQRDEVVASDLASGQALLLGHPPHDAERPLELGPRWRVEEQVRATQRAARRGRQLAVQGGVGAEPLVRAAPREALLDRAEVLVRRSIGGHREQGERARHGVVQGRQRLEGRLALALGHQLEVHRRELEAADQAPVDPQRAVDRFGGRPGGRRRGRRSGATEHGRQLHWLVPGCDRAR